MEKIKKYFSTIRTLSKCGKLQKDGFVSPITVFLSGMKFTSVIVY